MSVLILDTCTSDHGVGVDIDGIDRIGDGNGIVPADEFLNVTCITLGTVVDENLIYVEMNTAGQEIVLQDGLPQESVTLFGTVAVESFGG